jgi:O-antigen/teichoic acid export membrane protein
MRPNGAMTAASVAALTVGGLAFNILLKARGLIVVPLYARLLTPHDLGVISLAAALATLVAPAVHLGLPLGMLVELPHARPAEAVGRAFRSSLAVIGTASAAACLLLMWAISAVDPLQPLAPYALVIGALAAGMALREVGQVVPQLHRQVRFLAMIGIAIEYGGVTVGLLLVVWGWGTAGFLWGVAGLSLLGAAFALRRSYALVGPSRGFDPKFVRSALAVGVPMVAVTSAQWVVQSIDRFFLAHYDGPATVGVYSLGYSVASAVLVVAATVNLLFVPVAAELLRSAPERLVRFVEESVRLAVALLGLCVAGAYVLGAPVLHILGGTAYAAATAVFPLMVASYCLFTIVQLLQWIPLAVERRVGRVVATQTVMAALNVALDLALIPELGMNGAILAAVLSYAVGVVLMAAEAGRALPGWRWRAAFPAAMLAAGAAAAASLMRLPADAGGLAIAAAAAAVIVVYAILGLALTAVRREDFTLLRSAWTTATDRLRA